MRAGVGFFNVRRREWEEGYSCRIPFAVIVVIILSVFVFSVSSCVCLCRPPCLCLCHSSCLHRHHQYLHFHLVYKLIGPSYLPDTINTMKDILVFLKNDGDGVVEGDLCRAS